MKKIFCIALVFVTALAFFAFAACGAPEAPASPPHGTESDGEDNVNDIVYLTVGSNKVSVQLEKNEAAAALAELLKQGDITYVASDYGGFEKVGSLGFSLPAEDTELTTEAGDVILYMGNQIVLFYGSNTWSYTRLGKMQGVSAERVKEILTAENPVTVKISPA